MRELDYVTGAIVEVSIRLHRDLGTGLLESVYAAALAHALEQRGFQVERQKPIRFECLAMVFEEGFRADLLVDNPVMVELKSVERLGIGARQATPDLSEADEHDRWAAHQLRCPHASRGIASYHQRPSSVRVSA